MFFGGFFIRGKDVKAVILFVVFWGITAPAFGLSVTYYTSESECKQKCTRSICALTKSSGTSTKTCPDGWIVMGDFCVRKDITTYSETERRYTTFKYGSCAPTLETTEKWACVSSCGTLYQLCCPVSGGVCEQPSEI